jgi:hypothetical protein
VADNVVAEVDHGCKEPLDDPEDAEAENKAEVSEDESPLIESAAFSTDSAFRLVVELREDELKADEAEKDEVDVAVPAVDVVEEAEGEEALNLSYNDVELV